MTKTTPASELLAGAKLASSNLSVNLEKLRIVQGDSLEYVEALKGGELADIRAQEILKRLELAIKFHSES